MRKLIVAEHISLDGVVQAPGGPDEDRSGGFEYGGWSVPFSSEEFGPVIMELHAQPFDLLLGRNTYDIWTPYWPNQPKGNPIADAFNGAVKHVATHRPESLTWSESQALGPNLEQSVHTLKNTDGPNLLTWGSGEVVRQLLAAGLIDELWLFVYPVVLGQGKRLWDGTAMPAAYRVVSAKTTSTGIQMVRLERNGEVQTGSVG